MTLYFHVRAVRCSRSDCPGYYQFMRRSVGVSRLFQLLIIPSFYDAIGWEVCKDLKSDTCYFAIRSVWRKETDKAKLYSPVVRLQYPRTLQPTIQVQQISLKSAWVEESVASLKRIMVPIMVECASVGVDGTSYELSLNVGLAQVRYRWWHIPPEGWQAIGNWTQQTLEALELLLERSD